MKGLTFLICGGGPAAPYLLLINDHLLHSGPSIAGFRIYAKVPIEAWAESPAKTSEFIKDTRDGLAVAFKVPATPDNVPVGNGSSFVFARSGYPAPFPGEPNSNWTAIDLDICAAAEFVASVGFQFSNPLLW